MMEGNLNEDRVPCAKCEGEAERVVEGEAADKYRCPSCQHEFMIDWEADGVPRELNRWSKEELGPIIPRTSIVGLLRRKVS